MSGRDREWVLRAACREGVDPELFFPPSAAYASPALAVCRRCPVRGQCLTEALDAGDLDGIWGGTTRVQRARILNGTHGTLLGARNARKTKCANGHEYTEENTYLSPKTGHRRCRTCQRATYQRWKQRQRQEQEQEVAA